jgi:hypothetical protein
MDWHDSQQAATPTSRASPLLDRQSMTPIRPMAPLYIVQLNRLLQQLLRPNTRKPVEH